MNVSHRMTRLFAHLKVSSQHRNIFTLSMYRFEKNEVVFKKYHENQHGHFLIHRDQFSSNSLTRGLDLRLRGLIRPFGVTKSSDLCQKIISVECLRVTDRARALISEFSEGLIGRK